MKDNSENLKIVNIRLNSQQIDFLQYLCSEFGEKSKSECIRKMIDVFMIKYNQKGLYLFERGHVNNEN